MTLPRFGVRFGLRFGLRTSIAAASLLVVVGAAACSSTSDATSPGDDSEVEDGATETATDAHSDGPSTDAIGDTTTTNLPDATTDAAPTDTRAPGDGASGDASEAGSDAGPPLYEKLPCTLTVGTGSGRFDIGSTTGKAGDVICIHAGSYSAGSIKNVTDRTVQNDGGLVTITGVVELGDTNKVTLSGSGDDALVYGFLLSGPSASFVITGGNAGLTVHHFEAIAAGIFLDAGHTGLTWSGSTSGLVLYQCLLDRIHLKGSGQLFQGNYGGLKDLTNFASEFEMANILVEDSIGTGQNVVGGAGIFNLNAHDWTITAKNTVVVGSGDDRDTGIFLFGGSGKVTRIHRDGGWGWLVRNFGAQLGTTRGEFRCEDNVDVDTEYYGTCESRSDIDPDSLPASKLSSIDIFVRNNVSARKKDIKGGYTTAIALIPNLLVGTTATLTNNVGCENVNDYGDVDSLHFFTVKGTVVQSGNEALSSCAGIIDPITKKPL